jgi:hypothetical protein
MPNMDVLSEIERGRLQAKAKANEKGEAGIVFRDRWLSGEY